MVSTLFLVPTEFEKSFLSLGLLEQIENAKSAIRICGFGPIVSGIRTSHLIAEHSPMQVFLIGIAGTLDPRILVGTAVEFDLAICFGIGAGSGDGFIAASELGWHQWPDDPLISDSIPLNAVNFPLNAENSEPCVPLLTCCSTSANEHDVQLRLKKYPKAVAEDMEGFSVAAACRFAGLPLRIVRGISNRAGDRNKDNWQVREAMSAVEKSIVKVLCS